MGLDNSDLNALLRSLSKQPETGRTQTSKPNPTCVCCGPGPTICPYCEHEMALVEEDNERKCHYCGYICSAG